MVAMTQAGFSGSGRYFALPAGGRLRRRRRRPVEPCSAFGRQPASLQPPPWSLQSPPRALLPSGLRQIRTIASLHAGLERALGSVANNKAARGESRYQTRGMADTQIDHRDRARWPAADGAGRAGAAGGQLGLRAHRGLPVTRRAARIGNWRIRTRPARADTRRPSPLAVGLGLLGATGGGGRLCRAALIASTDASARPWRAPRARSHRAAARQLALHLAFERPRIRFCR